MGVDGRAQLRGSITARQVGCFFLVRGFFGITQLAPWKHVAKGLQRGAPILTYLSFQINLFRDDCKFGFLSSLLSQFGGLDKI